MLNGLNAASLGAAATPLAMKRSPDARDYQLNIHDVANCRRVIEHETFMLSPEDAESIRLLVRCFVSVTNGAANNATCSYPTPSLRCAACVHCTAQCEQLLHRHTTLLTSGFPPQTLKEAALPPADQWIIMSQLPTATSTRIIILCVHPFMRKWGDNFGHQRVISMDTTFGTNRCAVLVACVHSQVLSSDERLTCAVARCAPACMRSAMYKAHMHTSVFALS